MVQDEVLEVQDKVQEVHDEVFEVHDEVLVWVFAFMIPGSDHLSADRNVILTLA